MLRKSEGASWVNDTKTELALQLATAVSAKEMQRDSKAYLLLFTHFLSKNIISLSLVLSQVPVAASTQQITNNAEIETVLQTPLDIFIFSFSSSSSS